MLKLTLAAALFLSITSVASMSFAERVTEAAVEKACGDQIEGGCSGNKCATGCTKVEGGKYVDYGCVFPSTPGKTKATCNKITLGRTVPESPSNEVGGTAPLLNSD